MRRLKWTGNHLKINSCIAGPDNDKLQTNPKCAGTFLDYRQNKEIKCYFKHDRPRNELRVHWTWLTYMYVITNISM